EVGQVQLDVRAPGIYPVADVGVKKQVTDILYGFLAGKLVAAAYTDKQAFDRCTRQVGSLVILAYLPVGYCGGRLCGQQLTRYPGAYPAVIQAHQVKKAGF